jgi:hypothetical protein
MPLEWGKAGHTKAMISEVIDYYMNPEVHVAKVHPKFVKEVKILSNERDAVTWEQCYSLFGINLRSIVKSSLNEATNTIETRVLDGSGKGTRMTRSLKAIPTGTELHFTFRPKLGALGLFLKGRAKKGFEETVNEDLLALDALA